MGTRPLRTLLTVELPLALPVIMAGVRIATVMSISLVSIATYIGDGGLASSSRTVSSATSRHR